MSGTGSNSHSGTAAHTVFQTDTGQSYPGLSYTASAFMAMHHCNERDASIVPELAQFADRTVQFDENTTRILNTDTVTHQAIQNCI
jgi:hypothetical protein